MNHKVLMRHRRSDVPAYSFWILAKPRTRHPGLYRDAVTQAAKDHIPYPITTPDFEVEILYSTLARSAIRADVDNIIKPTLDALEGVAYLDDAQVRSVVATLFDRTRDILVSGRVEYIGRLFYSPGEDVLLVSVYSDSRLQELGGEDAVKGKRFEEWERELRDKLRRLKQ